MLKWACPSPVQLNNKEVQHACVNALRGDQKFQAIMDLPNNTPIHVPVQSLMPQGHTNDIEVVHPMLC